VPLHRDERKAALLDQALRYLGAPGVKLRRAVRCLAEEDEARVTDGLDQRVEVTRRRERPRHSGEPGGQRRIIRFILSRRSPPWHGAASHRKSGGIFCKLK